MCGQQYVGATGQLLHCRVNGHSFNIAHRRTKKYAVADHFNGEGHLLADITIVDIDQLDSHDPCLHKTWESIQVDHNPGDLTPSVKPAQ